MPQGHSHCKRCLSPTGNKTRISVLLPPGESAALRQQVYPKSTELIITMRRGKGSSRTIEKWEKIQGNSIHFNSSSLGCVFFFGKTTLMDRQTGLINGRVSASLSPLSQPTLAFGIRSTRLQEESLCLVSNSRAFPSPQGLATSSRPQWPVWNPEMSCHVSFSSRISVYNCKRYTHLYLCPLVPQHIESNRVKTVWYRKSSRVIKRDRKQNIFP